MNKTKKRYTIIKLISGEEIIAVYIKSKQYTVLIGNPIGLVTDGSIFNPKTKMQPYSLFSDWGECEINKSAIISEHKPTKEMVKYYDLTVKWMKTHLLEDVKDELKDDLKSLNGFLGDSPTDVNPSREAFYTHVLETCQFPKGAIH